MDRYTRYNSCIKYRYSKSGLKHELQMTQDEDHYDHVRGKRSRKNLYGSYDSHRFNYTKSWKRRGKNKKQWQKRYQTPDEIEFVTGRYPFEFLMDMYNKNCWVPIDYKHFDGVCDLIKRGYLEAGYTPYTRSVYLLDPESDIVKRDVCGNLYYKPTCRYEKVYTITHVKKIMGC